MICLLATGCVDARSAANSTAGFISRTAETDIQPVRSSRQAPAPEVVGFVEAEVTFAEPDNGGPVSAFGMRWIATPISAEALYVYDVPGTDGEVVGQFQPWESNFWVAERVRHTNSATWRRVTMADGTIGWTPASNLIAQPQKLSRSDAAAIQALASGVDLADLASSAINAESASGIQVDVATDEGNYQLLVDWSGRKISLEAVLQASASSAG